MNKIFKGKPRIVPKPNNQTNKSKSDKQNSTIIYEQISVKQKKQIDKSFDRTIKRYGEVIRKLGAT